MAAIEKLAMHQGTTPYWSFKQAVDGYARHGFRAITVKRDKLNEHGLAAGAKLIADAGLEVIGLSGISPMTASDPAKRAAQLEDNKRAIDDAAAVGAGFVVVIGGPMPEGSRDMAATRALMSDMMAELLPYATERNVQLGLEPITPMAAGEISSVNTMAMANDMCEALGPGTGLVVDLYHVWWDPNLRAELERSGRGPGLLAFHVCDWRVPTRDRFQDRAMMGDGIINIPEIEGWMRDAGFDGWNEIEIFSAEDWWKRDPDEFLTTCVERYKTHV
ncbi:MAG: sugar phosphate isomerase/epimerase [Rhizobiales bacterium]|nr:sugar phosphate isomerase/epimerase [Hyphomicrobiales bacterium]